MPKNDKPIYAKNYLVNKWKISPVAAAGIVGNLQGESGLNTKAVGDNGTSYGIAQWHNERRTALNNFARKQNKDASHLDTQLDYLVYELNTSEKKAFNKINLAKTPEQAAIAFMNHFERPAEWAKKESVGKRVAYAKNIFGDNSPTAESINYKEEPTEAITEEDKSFFKNYVSPQEQQFAYNLPQVDESTTEPSKQFKSDLAKDRIVQKEKEQVLIQELSQLFKQEEHVQQEPQQAQQLDPSLYQVYNIQHPELDIPQFQQGGKKPTTVKTDKRTTDPDKYLKNWVTNPEFVKRLDNYNENLPITQRRFDLFGLLDSYGENTKQTAIENLSPDTKLYYNLPTEEVEKVEKRRNTGMGYEGEFFKENGKPSIYVNDYSKPTSTYLHERTHQAGIRNYIAYFSNMLKNKDFKDDTQSDYLKRVPNEIYPRLMQFRYENKIKPGQVFSEEQVKKYRKAQLDKDNSTFGFPEAGSADIFKLFNDKELKEILNKVASNNKDTKNLNV